MAVFQAAGEGSSPSWGIFDKQKDKMIDFIEYLNSEKQKRGDRSKDEWLKDSFLQALKASLDENPPELVEQTSLVFRKAATRGIDKQDVQNIINSYKPLPRPWWKKSLTITIALGFLGIITTIIATIIVM